MKDLIPKLSAPMICGGILITAGVIVYALINDYDVEVKSLFFGEWKLIRRKV